jgi:aminoglycoside phosphotransferase (APT) family kinase protein
MEYLKNCGKGLIADILEAKINGIPEALYIIETFLLGKSLEKYTISELDNYTQILTYKLSSYLFELHSIHDSKFHNFIGDSYPTYTEMLEVRLNQHIHTVKIYDNNFAKHLFKIIETLHKHKKSMINIIPSFLHFDLKPQNIIFDKETSSIGLVDFEHARFGDPFHELVRTKIIFSQNAFFRDLWSQVENIYLRKIGAIPLLRNMIYELYYYVSELPYLYQVNDTDKILKLHKLIEETLLDLK